MKHLSCTEDILSETLLNVWACPESDPTVLLKVRGCVTPPHQPTPGALGTLDACFQSAA